MYKKVIKPAFDFIAALVSLVLLSPFFLIIAIVLFFVNQRKVFFTQKRAGYNEKIFTIIKFRTLRDIYDENGKQLPDFQRQFAFGTLIRRLHLDEMPQLFDILQGSSSFIGPRPLLPEYLPYYTEDQRKRHDVKPGITGLSQVNGANSLDWGERLRLDAFYAENCTCKMDLSILISTIRYIFMKPKAEKEKQLFSESFIDYYNRNTQKGI